MQPQVVIVGAGPVGLTLAIDLGKRNIRTLVVEQKPEPAFLPKMERCNARTMEIFRRLGIVEDVRKAGLREDIPMDVFVVLSLTQPPLLRLPYPSVREARLDARATNDGTAPCEPYQLISQYTLEPVLAKIAASLPTVELAWSTEFLGMKQDADAVDVDLRKSDGSTTTLRCDYMVGCDGGVSPVRHALDIKLRGEANLLGLRQALFKCDDLFDKIPIGNGPTHGRHYHVADDKATFLIMQDSTKHWTLHATVDTDEEMKQLFEETVGIPVKYEMLSCNPWRQNLLVAEKYGRDRVFLAGDAVHLVIPTGGLGMNSGCGDAIDLGWKLVAVLQGWGGPNLLPSYEFERRQIGDRNVGASRYASQGRRKWRSMWKPNIRDNTPEGQQTREVLTMIADIEQRKTNEMIGAELGYRYVDSPIICDIPGGPEHLFREYIPNTWPGSRLPNVWLSDGAPLQDRIPDGYTILRLGSKAPDVSGLEKAVASYGAPVATLDIPDQVAREVYGFDVILLRPDMHIVWRGNAMPEDPASVAATATGH
jgi:2-polyprenyl-6-methoxyphenol hydroxylase-like FAD-dependent oxidoreductase